VAGRCGGTPPARAGVRAPSPLGCTSSAAAGEQEGRMIQEGGERIRGTEFILCIVGPYFFIFGKLKCGIPGDCLFFLFPYLFGDLANNEIWGEKK